MSSGSKEAKVQCSDRNVEASIKEKRDGVSNRAVINNVVIMTSHNRTTEMDYSMPADGSL